MVTKVQKWGNSQGLRVSRDLLLQARIEVGDEVEISARDGAIVITPSRRVRGRLNLDELVARIPRGHKPESVEWGKPEGREAW